VTFASSEVYCTAVSFISIQGGRTRGSERHTAGPKATSAVRRRWLTFLVHRDAFRLDWLGYTQALFWRLRGLRLRSRNRLAALMGRSSHAYSLWMARAEARALAELLERWEEGTSTIIPIVDCSASPRATDLTLRSIGWASPHPLFMGSNQGPSTKLADVAQLAGQLSPQGSWICIVRAGDQLAHEALSIYSRAAAQWPDSWVIYSDDDLIEGAERRFPHFKPSWNPDLFEHHDFVTGSAIIRVTPDMTENLPVRDWAKLLTDRAIARGSPVHLSAILHHRTQRSEPSIPEKPHGPIAGPCPMVSIIVPTRNRFLLLKTCVEGIRTTDYPHIDLIVVDNDSDDRETLTYLEVLGREGATVLRIPGSFNFSALNNAAVEHAQGELLCFLNNDVEIVDPDWLSLLVRQAIRSELGAVGGRLLYPDGTVQHAGVVIGVGGGAAHAHRSQRLDEAGYFCRDRLPQQVTAVTAACLVVERNKFTTVGGFNEKDFPVAFNDVDLCLKLNSRGWQSFYEPRAVLIHHESKSRGRDSAKENRDRFATELRALKRIWGTNQTRDPYHHPQLSLFCEQFHIAV
jgi:O-antigen biosynthesis protein